MAFKMKGFTPFNQSQSQWKGTEGQDQNKIFDDKGKHTGNWVDGKKVLFKDKKPPNDDMAYFNKLEAKEKAGKLSDSEKKALARLRSEQGELKK